MCIRDRWDGCGEDEGDDAPVPDPLELTDEDRAADENADAWADLA